MKTLIVLLLPILIVLPGLKSNCQDFRSNYSLKNHPVSLKKEDKNLNVKDLISKPGNSEDYTWFDYWHHATNTVYTYNDKGVLIEELVTFASAGECMFKSVWTYDNYDNLSEYIYYSWNYDVWEIVFGARYLYTYDDSGNILEMVYQLWSIDNWVNYSKTEYTIGIQGEWIEYFEYLWENDEWINEFKFTDIVWHNWDKFQLQSFAQQEWSDEWVNSDRFNYTYTGDNYIGIWEVFENENWIFNERETCSISETEEIDISEIYENEMWINEEKYSVYFNEFGATTRRTLEIWEDANWMLVIDNFFLLTYNDNDDLIEEIRQSWDNVGQSWNNMVRFIYSDFQYFELGLEENSLVAQINIYPNPVTSILTIDFNEGENRAEMVQIFTVTGQKVYEEKLIGKQNKIDVSTLSEGLYILQLFTSDRIVINRKFLKQ